jgi:hypothetical protein
MSDLDPTCAAMNMKELLLLATHSPCITGALANLKKLEVGLRLISDCTIKLSISVFAPFGDARKHTMKDDDDENITTAYMSHTDKSRMDSNNIS